MQHLNDFLPYLRRILEYEGGFVDDPHDPGGRTKYGISEKAYPNVNIDELTLNDAADIYWRDYWLAAKCQDLPPLLRYLHFDTAVNMGVRRAVKFLQQAVRVEDDGIFGPVTMKAVETTPSNLIFQRYCALRLKRYTYLVTFPRFGRGWVRRVADIIENPFV